jgi:hypothetical protein
MFESNCSAIYGLYYKVEAVDETQKTCANSWAAHVSKIPKSGTRFLTYWAAAGASTPSMT